MSLPHDLEGLSGGCHSAKNDGNSEENAKFGTPEGQTESKLPD